MFFFCFSLILWELPWKWLIVVQKCDNCKQFYNIAIVKDTHALQLFSHQIKLCFSCLTLFQEDILFYLIKVHCLRLGKSQFTFPIKLPCQIYQLHLHRVHHNISIIYLHHFRIREKSEDYPRSCHRSTWYRVARMIFKFLFIVTISSVIANGRPIIDFLS